MSKIKNTLYKSVPCDTWNIQMLEQNNAIVWIFMGKIKVVFYHI